MATRKTIINSLPAGLTTLDLPTTTTSGEIVLFGSGDNVLAGSGVTINAQKDLTPLRSATLSTTAANPGGATTVWINSANNKLYLGANQVDGGITLGPIGAAPNANGATVTGSTLNLEPASASFGGVLTTGTQTIAGAKTLSGALTLQSTVTMPNTAQIIHVGSSAPLLTCNNVAETVSCGNFAVAAGARSCAFGPSAGRSSVGIRNVYVGYRAGAAFAGDTGNNNVLIGYQAFENVQNATRNVIIGAEAARNPSAMTTNNTIIGYNACNPSTAGRANNIVIGSGAGASLGTTSDNNIYLGNVGAAESNTIRIGTQGTQLTCQIAGISARTSTAGVAVFCNTSGILGTVTSSSRFKNTIADIDTSFTEKIYDMRVVSFLYNDDPSNRPQYGMVAEEVEQIMPEICIYDSEEPDTPVQTIQYHVLVPLMLKELQRLKARVDALEAA